MTDANEKPQRISVKVDEEESGAHPDLPPARVTGTKLGPDGSTYWLLTLDHSVMCERLSTGQEWEIRYLLVKPKFRGDRIDRIYGARPEAVPVGIANILDERVLSSPTFDWTQVEYFAVGYVQVVDTRG